jgi:hypothetical protein
MTARMTAADREKMYTDYLRAEGYRPDMEQDGSVAFKKGNQTYFIVIDDESQLFMLMLPWRAFKGDKALAAKALKAALHATDKSKVAKVYVQDDDALFITAQLFIEPPELFRNVIRRCMTALDDADQYYEEAMAQG